MPTFQGINFRGEKKFHKDSRINGKWWGPGVMDSFSLQNEKLMHSLTEEDEFTPPWLIFFLGSRVPLFLHTGLTEECRKACLFGEDHSKEPLCISPSLSPLLVPLGCRESRITAQCFCWLLIQETFAFPAIVQ